MITNILASITITLSTNVVSERKIYQERSYEAYSPYISEPPIGKDVTYQVVQTKVLEFGTPIYSPVYPRALGIPACFNNSQFFTNTTILTNFTRRLKRVEQWEEIQTK